MPLGGTNQTPFNGLTYNDPDPTAQRHARLFDAAGAQLKQGTVTAGDVNKWSGTLGVAKVYLYEGTELTDPYQQVAAPAGKRITDITFDESAGGMVITPNWT